VLPLQSDPPIRLLAVFYEHFSLDNPAIVVQAPDRDMWVVAAVNDSREVTLVAPDLNGQTTFSYQSAKRHQTVRNRPLPGWARYPAGVVVALGNAGLDTGGVFAVIAGEEPHGPRYLYSLGLVMAALAHHLAAQPYDAQMLAEIVERARRDYVEG
jgi:galactokinase